jgi:uncharacterized coiled-coil protein SlyX
MTTDDKDLVETLFAATAHGDPEHRAWLHEAYTEFFAGRPVPKCRGRGNKEARIAELEAKLAEAADRIEQLSPGKLANKIALAMQQASAEIGATEQQRIAFAYAEAAMRSTLQSLQVGGE